MSFKGRENVYACRECGGYTVTIDRDEGTTPFLLDCRASGREGDCKGLAQSCFYPKGPLPPWIPAPSWEWYKPTREEELAMDPRLIEHVSMGGLLIRKRACEVKGGP